MTSQNYSFDPTGQASTNLVTQEKQMIFSPDWKDYHFIIPKAAPYFLNSMVIKMIDNGRELVEGLDWLASFKFSDASRATGKNVYGSITILDKTLSGEIELTYQTIGGEWVISDTKIAQLLTQVQTNPRITTWEEVVNPPNRFPIINHEWDLVDMVGVSDVVNSLSNLETTISEKPSPTTLLNAHISDHTNPHNTNKVDIDLGLVENYPIATEDEAKIGVRNDRYTTPKTVKAAIDRFAVTSDKEYYTKNEVDALIANLQQQIDNI